jgi:site-specific DNA recombinase
MSHRRERMGIFTRESDPRVASSITMESAARIAREHGERQGYLYDSACDWREAVSSVEVPYMKRQQLQAMLAAAKRKQFDVLVVSEIRAISRRQVEVLVIYDQLQKYGIRFETVKEKFGEDAVSKAILSMRAMSVEVEVEQSKTRMERGKRDRVAIGQAPRVTTLPYTHILVDTDREVKGRYILNTEVVYTDEEGRQWTRIDVAKFFCDLLAKGCSLRKTCWLLNDMGIPTAKGKIWVPTILRGIVTNPIMYGQPYANRYGLVKSVSSRSGKETYYERLRPPEDWIPLPPCPPVITHEQYDRIQAQIDLNKAESIRNNKLEDPGLVRAGYIFCGICGGRMSPHPPSKSSRSSVNLYECRKKACTTAGYLHNHRINISMRIIDNAVRQKIAERVADSSFIHERVAELREDLKPIIDKESVFATLADLEQAIQEFLELARHAKTTSMVASLVQQMNDLESQKRSAEKLLFAIEVDEVEKAEIEAELVKFEKWTQEARPHLGNPEFLKTASYDELRLAVRIIGVKVTVFPRSEERKQRYHIDVTAPGVTGKIHSDSRDPYPSTPDG